MEARLEAARRPLVGVEYCVQRGGREGREEEEDDEDSPPSSSADPSDIAGSLELRKEREY